MNKNNMTNELKNEIVTEDNSTVIDNMIWATDASDIGLKAGVPWPTQIATSLGNKMDFRFTHGGVDEAHYLQGNGCIRLVVFND